MKNRIALRILMTCLLPLISSFSHNQFENPWNANGRSISDEGTIAASFFQVTQISTNKMGVTKDAYDGPFPQYTGIGKIKYLGKRTLNDYSLEPIFILYNDSYESFTIGKSPGSYHDGFGSVFRTKVPWEPNQEMPFEVTHTFSAEDILYPIKKVEVVYHILASDPFGHSYDEKIKTYDITDSWLNIQNRFKSAVKQKKKYSVETPVVEKDVPENETSGRYDQKAAYGQQAKYGEAKQHVVAEEVKEVKPGTPASQGDDVSKSDDHGDAAGTVDSKALYGKQGGGGGGVSMSGFGGFGHPNITTPELPSNSNGIYEFKVKIDADGYVTTVTTLQRGQSYEAERRLKATIQWLRFLPKGDPQPADGRITFRVVSE